MRGVSLGLTRRRSRLLGALTAACALALSACGDHATAPGGESDLQIVSGIENARVGSGREVRIAPIMVQHDTWDRYGAPHTTQTAPLDAATWSALLATIDETALTALPEVVGCPGCADGPTEWLEVRRGTFQKRVRFSPGDDLGAGNTALLGQVRALRGE